MLRALANERSNIPQLLSNGREIKSGGTGIRPTEPGNTIILYNIENFGTFTFGACNAAIILCLATLYAASYAITDKNGCYWQFKSFTSILNNVEMAYMDMLGTTQAVMHHIKVNLQ